MNQGRPIEPTDYPQSAPYEVPIPPPAATSPALRPPRWSGKKTAIVAALAISVASAGTLGATAAVPQGTGASAGSGMRGGPGMGTGMGSGGQGMGPGQGMRMRGQGQFTPSQGQLPTPQLDPTTRVPQGSQPVDQTT